MVWIKSRTGPKEAILKALPGSGHLPNVRSSILVDVSCANAGHRSELEGTVFGILALNPS